MRGAWDARRGRHPRDADRSHESAEVEEIRLHDVGAFVLDLALPGIPGLVCAVSVSTAAAALLLFAVDRRFNLELAGTLTRVFPATAFVLSSQATARAARRPS